MAREQTKTRSGWRRWLMGTGAAVGFIFMGVAVYKVHAFAMTEPQFTLSREAPGALLVHGLRNASRARVWRVFDVDFGRSVFAVPLAERRRRLMAIDWVADASVSRIWPNRLVVRIAERQPVAFVNLPLATGTARLLLIDAEGVLLEPPPQSRFSFPVLSGVAEDDSEEVRRIRVRAMLRLLDELGAAARDISEVNTADLDNLRAITQLDGRAVELQMGDGNYGRRYQAFLANYPEMRKRSRGVRVFDLRLDDRITARE
jgi:cell division protein FtsQ